MKPSVAVVILNWNGKRLLQQFLPSVVNSNYPNLQIVVGDNCSNDGSVEFVKTNYPLITVLQNKRNYGFAEGYNRVLAQVTADYYVLLNSDVEVPEDWITPVINLMEADEQIAAAQPKIKWQLDKTQYEYAGAAGGFLDKYAFPFCRGRIFDAVEKDLAQYDDVKEVFWASGAALFIKSTAWKAVGGLDGDLFAHMEEIDLCWRLKNKGYKVMFCPDAEVYHVGGGSLNATNPFKTFLNFRNNLVIMQKNLPKAEVFQMIFIRFFIDFAALIHFLIKGETKFAWAVSKAHVDFFKRLKETNRKRTTVQLPYYQHKGVLQSSIVYNYFIKKIKCFSHLTDSL